MKVDVTVSVDVTPTPRMRQVSSMFDAPIAKKATRSWVGDVGIEERPWQIGLIVGPSGAGKTTIARQMFGPEHRVEWDGRSVVDNFDPSLGVDQIAEALGAVGFNTIPAWLRPHGTLSNGEKFRCDLARVQEDVLAARRVMQQEEAATTDTRAHRLDHRQCRRHRDRRIEGIAAFAQDPHARLGGECL